MVLELLVPKRVFEVHFKSGGLESTPWDPRALRVPLSLIDLKLDENDRILCRDTDFLYQEIASDRDVGSHRAMKETSEGEKGKALGPGEEKMRGVGRLGDFLPIFPF